MLLSLCLPGPRVDWDPDIVAALDSDNDEPIDEDFEDDFIAIANQSGDEEEWEEPSSDKLGDRQRQWIQDQMVDGAIAFEYVLAIKHVRCILLIKGIVGHLSLLV